MTGPATYVESHDTSCIASIPCAQAPEVATTDSEVSSTSERRWGIVLLHNGAGFDIDFDYTIEACICYLQSHS